MKWLKFISKNSVITPKNFKMKLVNLCLLLPLLITQCKSKEASGNQHADNGLYYFATKDSAYVGVEDESGNIVIPAESRNMSSYDFKNPIKEHYLDLWGSRENKNPRGKSSENSPIKSCTETYDRRGKFLYKVLCFDNGADYFSEGLRRSS